MDLLILGEITLMLASLLVLIFLHRKSRVPTRWSCLHHSVNCAAFVRVIALSSEEASYCSGMVSLASGSAASVETRVLTLLGRKAIGEHNSEKYGNDCGKLAFGLAVPLRSTTPAISTMGEREICYLPFVWSHLVVLDDLLALLWVQISGRSS